MRTSLNELEQIEAYLHGKPLYENMPLIEARLLLDESFRSRVAQQRLAYEVIRAYGQKELRAELEQIHERLLSQKRYARIKKKITELFSKKR